MQEENEIREWIGEIIKRDLPKGPLDEVLKDGIVLCDLMNTILSKDPTLDLKCPKRSPLGFVQMENIEYFIEKARAMKVPDFENFQTIDLFEGKNMKQVYTCIYSLSRNLYRNGRSDIRVIGPKLTERVSISFTQDQLDEAKRTVSLQYGRINNK